MTVDLRLDRLALTPAEKLAGEVDSIHERLYELHQRETAHAGTDYREYIPKWNNVWHRLERAMADALGLTRREGDVFDEAHHCLGTTLKSLIDGIGSSDLYGLAARIREAEGLDERGL